MVKQCHFCEYNEATTIVTHASFEHPCCEKCKEHRDAMAWEEEQVVRAAEYRLDFSENNRD